MVNKPLIRPYFRGGGTLGGGWLTSHKLNRLPKTTSRNMPKETPFGTEGLFSGFFLMF